ncbi:MAG TPA: GTPase HflX [Candidatus Anaerobiospirillum stercoravium]|nr:GTPase HflX [Candidatus Anaerobiospirillum stercoravium]
MAEQEFEPLGPTILVHVELPQAKNQEDLHELQRLAESAGSTICDALVCRREVIEPRTYIGSGKVQELADAVRAHDAKVVVFNCPLTPAQERNLEKEVGVRVMDRIALILVIFAMRARTYEGKLQVELAQLRYEQARLVRGWTHLERQKGGFGLRGGPGETQIELDRRALRERIAAIKQDLEVVARRREQNRSERKKNAIAVVSFVGYTNAGKSTLFNTLTRSEVYAADQLFATLDPTLRNMVLPTVGRVVFADTVGFIRHLPHELVAAFRATLEETIQSDLLLHIIDISDPRIEDNIEAVNAVLGQIGADQVPTLLVFNKSDLKDDVAIGIVRNEAGRPVRVNVSAKTQAGLDDLVQAVAELLALDQCEFELRLGYQDGKLRASLYELKAIQSSSYDEQGQEHLKVALKPQDCARIDKLSGGRLSACLVRPEGKKPTWVPWVQEEDFDFDEID